MRRAIALGLAWVNGEYATKTWNFNHNYDQCWKMQIGIKYTFN